MAKTNPAPTFQDPQGFAIGVLPLKELGKQDVHLVQWRFRYGPATRTDPFQPHVDVDGQFMTADGHTSAGFHPGDHRGCQCSVDPVFRKPRAPAVVDDQVDADAS